MKRQSLSPMKRLAVFEANAGLCHICSRRIQVGEKWEVEHILPLALRGVDDETNMSPAHVKCHSVKTADDVARIAKSKRQAAKHIGAKRPTGWQSKWKRKVSGETVLR